MYVRTTPPDVPLPSVSPAAYARPGEQAPPAGVGATRSASVGSATGVSPCVPGPAAALAVAAAAAVPVGKNAVGVKTGVTSAPGVSHSSMQVALDAAGV